MRQTAIDLRTLIRDIPDFPEPGILFRDITPLLANPEGLKEVNRLLVERYRDRRIDKVVGIESRGFIFGAPLALALGAGFIPARKPGKLPHKTVEETYTLEYGSNILTMHEDGIEDGEQILVVDDLLATGGTLGATCNLIERLRGEIVEVAVLIELTALGGRDNLGGRPFHTLLQY